MAQLPHRFTCCLMPASEFTIAELTDIYNRTRVDYIVPMPMNAVRLATYIETYDLDLDRSVVATYERTPLGLAMLGVRPGRTWITRLGIIPNRRRMGAGRAIMGYLIARSQDLGASYVVLEVIKGNEPAHRLFTTLGFRETRDLLILRRPPGPPRTPGPAYDIIQSGQDRALDLLRCRRSTPSWLDEYDSLRNAGDLASMEVELATGARGWLVYQTTVFQLGRLVLQTDQGRPADVARALAHAVHATYPYRDAKTENLPALDAHLPGLLAMGYMESFRRTEMRLHLGSGAR